jgi:hypothetical protein
LSKLYKLLHQKGIEFYQNDRRSLDNYYYEPFQDDKEHFEDDRKFETESIKGIKKKIDLYNRSIFKYFLDGSRNFIK